MRHRRFSWGRGLPAVASSFALAAGLTVSVSPLATPAVSATPVARALPVPASMTTAAGVSRWAGAATSLTRAAAARTGEVGARTGATPAAVVTRHPVAAPAPLAAVLAPAVVDRLALMARSASTPVAPPAGPAPTVAQVATRATAEAAVVRTDAGCAAGTDVWNGAGGDGQWTTAANWAGGEPGSATSTCIPAGATVTLGTSTTITGLDLFGTLGTSPSVTLAVTGPAPVVVESGASLTVNGLDTCGGNDSSALDATGGVVNDGTLDLTHTGNCAGGSSDVNLGGTSVLANAGTMTVTASASPGAAEDLISGSVQDTGTTTIVAGTLGLPTGSSWNEQGELTVDSAAALDVATGAAFTASSGTITVDPAPAGGGSAGAITDRGTWTEAASVVTGPDVVVTGALVFTGGGASSFAVPPNASATLQGDLVSGQAVRVEGQDVCSGNDAATLTTVGDVVSAGTIELKRLGNCAAGQSILDVAAGHSLTSTGSLVFDGQAGPETLAGTVVSSGPVTVGAGIAVADSGSFANQGALGLAAGTGSGSGAVAAASWTVAVGSSFTNASTGSVVATGTFTDNGTLTEAGTTSGTDLVVTGALVFTGGGASSFAVPPNASATLQGDLASGQAVRVEGQDVCSGNDAATLTTVGDVVSAGTIELKRLGNCAAGQSILDVAAGHSLTSTGSLVFDGQAGPETLAGTVVSSGPVTVGAGIAVADSGSFANQGALGLAAGTGSGPSAVAASWTVAVGSSFTNASTGSVADGGTFTDNGSFYEAGTSSGADLVTTGALVFTGGGASSFAVPPNAGATLAGNVAAPQTVRIEGQDVCSGNDAATLTAVGDLTSAGTIELKRLGTCAGGQSILDVAAGHTLTSTGTLLFDGQTGPETLAGTVVSAGTTTVGSGISVTDSGSFANQGAFTVAGATTGSGAVAAASWTVAVGSSFTNASTGSVAATGTFTDNGTLTEAGTTSGTDLVVTGALVFTGGGASSFAVPPNASATLQGDLASGQAVRVEGQDVCSGNDAATLTTVGDVVSAGTIELKRLGNCAAGQSILDVAAGHSLTSTGSLVFDGQAGPETVAGIVISSGSLTVAAGTLISFDEAGSAGQLSTSGSVTVAAGGSLTANVPLVATAGTITNPGTITTTGDLDQGAATETGNPYQVTAALNLLGTGPAQFEVPANATSTLTGTIAPGQVLDIAGVDACSGNDTARVNAVGNLLVQGTLQLDHQGGCGGGDPILALPPGGTITNDGRVLVTGTDSGNTAVITASMVGPGLLQGIAHASISGSLTTSGPLSWVSSPGHLGLGVAGTLTLEPGATAAGSCTSGTCQAFGLASATISPSASLRLGAGAGLVSSGTLTDSGTLTLGTSAATVQAYTQTATGALQVGVDATVPTGGLISASGPVALAGTLAITTVGTTTPQSGATVPLVTYSVETGGFGRITGEAIGHGLAYSVSIPASAATSPGSVSLVVGSISAQTGLAVTTVGAASPGSVAPGRAITTTYTVTNTGADPATGTWQDSVYLGTGSSYTPGDPLIARIPYTGGTLDPGQSYTVAVHGFVPPVAPGTEHLVIVPDSADLVSATYADQQATSPDLTIEPVPTLTPGTPVQETVASGQDLYYQVPVGTQGDVRVGLAPGAGSVATDFAAFGRMSSPSDFDRQSSPASGVVALPGAAPGTWYLDVHGNDGAGAGTVVTVDPELPGLSVAATTPNTGADAGPVTVAVQGYDLGADTTAALTSGATTVPATIVRKDSTAVFATFNLAGVPTGTYTLSVTSGGATVTGPSPFTVTGGATGSLQITSSAPASLRYGWQGPVTVTITNTGGTDVDLPVVRLTGQNATVGLPGGTLAGSVDVVAPDFSTPATGPLSPGVVAPGQTGTLTFTMLSASTVPHIGLLTTVQTVDSTSPGTIDWATQLASDRPAGLSDGAWNAIVAAVAADAGTTERSYATTLLQVVQDAASHGVTLHSEAAALDYLVRQQTAAGAGASVSGTLTAAGTPAAQTSLTLTSTTNPSTSLQATSWYDGHFAFDDVPAGTYDLSATGLLPRVLQTVTVGPSSTPTGLAVPAQPGATLSGVVSEAGAGPIAAAVVTAVDTQGTVTSAPTAADGSYHIAGVAPGAVTVSASAPGHVPSPSVPATAPAAGPLAQDFALAVGDTVSGTVTASSGGLPPTGTTVTAVGTGGLRQSTTVNADGTYAISGLTDDTYAVTAVAVGVGNAATTATTSGGTGTTSGVDLQLSSAVTVEGTVTDAATGAPIAGVSVYADGQGAPAPTTTAADGTYTLTGVVDGPQTLHFAPSDGGHSPATAAITPSSGAALTANQALVPFGHLDASVVDGNGDPLPDVSTELVGPGPTANGAVGTAQAATTDSTGELHLTSLPAGNYDLQVVGSSVHQAFTIGAANLAEAPTLTVPVAILHGSVVDATGAGMSGVPVSADTPAGPLAVATTAADGSWTMDLTAAAEVDIEVNTPATGVLVARGVQAVVGSTTAVPALQVGTAVLPVTVDAGVTPIAGATVQVEAAPAAAQPALVVAATDGAGDATVSPLAAGSYTVTVTAPGHAPLTQAVTVAAGMAPVALQLAAGGGLAGIVGDPSGPVANAVVTAKGGSSTFTTVTAADGTWSIPALAAGTYALSEHAAGHAEAVQATEAVSAGSTTTVNATLATSGDSLSVSLQGPSPLLAGVVSVVDGVGATVATGQLGPAVSTSAAAATTTIGPLAAGTYTVVFQAPGTAPTSTTASVGSGTNTASLGVGAPEALPVPLPVAAAPQAVRSSATAQATSAARTAATPAAAAPPPFSASELLQSWLGGDKNRPPQRADADNAALQARYQADVSQNLGDCPDPEKAALQALLSRYLAAKEAAFGAWQSAYDAQQQLKQSQLLQSTYDVLNDAQSIASLYLSFEASAAEALSSLGAGASAANESVAGLKYADVIAAVNGAANAVYSAGVNIYGLIANPPGDASLNSIASVLGTLNSVAAALNTTLGPVSKNPELAEAFGPAFALAQLLLNLVSTYTDLQNFEQEAANLLNAAEAADTQYTNTLLAFYQALADYESYSGQGTCPPPPPPPNPPPPPPPPPNQPQRTDNHLPGDPNGIIGTVGVGAAHAITAGTGVAYQIHFQNEPTATAPAVQVVVTTQVPAGVDPASVELTGFGFGSTNITVPAGLQQFHQVLDERATIGDFVDVAGSYDRATGTITWTLSTINPATGDLDGGVSAGFLPPDDAAGDGEGYVDYAATTLSSLAGGTTIPAQASIVFDRNAAMATNVWTNVIGTGGSGGGTGPTGSAAAYRLVAADGGVFSYGGAPFEGSAGGLHLAAPIVGSVPTPDGKGYWLVASDGGVFAYGDAGFYGSAGAVRLAKPVVGMAATPDGKGYWLVASDGGIFAYGDATFRGSAGALPLAKPVVGMAATADGGGYWLVASDGGIFSYGDATFHGSAGALPLARPVVGMAATADGGGYWLVASDGGVFSYGDASFAGSAAGLPLTSPIVTIQPAAGQGATPSAALRSRYR